MAHLDEKSTDDSVQALPRHSFDSGKHELDESPTETQFPEILYTTDPIDERKKPLPRRREETVDPRQCPPVIPPKHPNRTLILCFDGTGDQFDADNSNVVQLVSLLKKDDSTKQLVYYQVRFSFPPLNRCCAADVYTF